MIYNLTPLSSRLPNKEQYQKIIDVAYLRAIFTSTYYYKRYRTNGKWIVCQKDVDIYLKKVSW